MKKQLLISIAATLPLLAQIPPAGNALQQSGWFREALASDVRTMDVHSTALDGQAGPVLCAENHHHDLGAPEISALEAIPIACARLGFHLDLVRVDHHRNRLLGIIACHGFRA